MKKKMLSVISMVATMSMLAGSLTGCGTQAEATDQVMNEETVIVVDTEQSSEETIVVPTTSEEATAPVVAEDIEDENIVLYIRKGEHKYAPLNTGTYEQKNVSFTAGEQILLYDGEGYEVGYVKANGNVTVTEYATDCGWDRFENPIGIGYDYLYILRKNVPDENLVVVTTDDLIEKIIEQMNKRDYELPTILDTPTSDMESYEFLVSKSSPENVVNYWSNGTELLGYMTYAIEVKEESDCFICTVYYKDYYDLLENQQN